MDGDTCSYYCSKPYGGIRYCGSGPDFTGPGSVDCSGCKTWSKSKSADFSIHTHDGDIDGKFTIEKRDHDVQWKVGKLTIDDTLIEKYCGTLKWGESPSFTYHVHEEWNFEGWQKSAVGECGPEKTGGHWDPTAACGPASGNPVCGEKYCNTKGKDYTCDAEKFNSKSRAQYRMLSPSPLYPNDVTCEFGDLSGMAGPIKGNEDKWKHAVVTEEKSGEAMMSATFGEITPWTLDAEPCYYNTLAKRSTKKSYELASDKYPLDQLPHDASVLVHCGSGYQNAGQRFFCAKLE